MLLAWTWQEQLLCVVAGVIVPATVVFLRWGSGMHFVRHYSRFFFLFPSLELCVQVLFFIFFLPPLDVVVVPESRFFSFFSYTFFFFLSICLLLSARYIDTWLPPSNLFSSPHKSPPKQLLFFFFFCCCPSLRWTKRRKIRRTTTSLMSELIKACRSCICCPVCWPGLASLVSSFHFQMEKKEKKMCRTSIFLYAMPTNPPKKSACVQKLPDWNLTEKVKRQKNEIKMKRKCLVSSDDVTLSTTSDPDSSMNNSDNFLFDFQLFPPRPISRRKETPTI